MRNVKAHDLLGKVESPDSSTIVEAAVNMGVRSIAFEDLCCKCHSVSYVCIRRKLNLVDDVLDYMQLCFLNLPMFCLIIVHSQVMFNVSLSLMSNPAAWTSLIAWYIFLFKGWVKMLLSTYHTKMVQPWYNMHSSIADFLNPMVSRFLVGYLFHTRLSCLWQYMLLISFRTCALLFPFFVSITSGNFM